MKLRQFSFFLFCGVLLASSKLVADGTHSLFDIPKDKQGLLKRKDPFKLEQPPQNQGRQENPGLAEIKNPAAVIKELREQLVEELTKLYVLRSRIDGSKPESKPLPNTRLQWAIITETLRLEHLDTAFAELLNKLKANPPLTPEDLKDLATWRSSLDIAALISRTGMIQDRLHKEKLKEISGTEGKERALTPEELKELERLTNKETAKFYTAKEKQRWATNQPHIRDTALEMAKLFRGFELKLGQVDQDTVPAGAIPEANKLAAIGSFFSVNLPQYQLGQNAELLQAFGKELAKHAEPQYSALKASLSQYIRERKAEAAEKKRLSQPGNSP